MIRIGINGFGRIGRRIFRLLLEKEDIKVVAINKAFKKAAETNFKGIVEYTDDPIVSIDVIRNSHCCVFDAKMTSVLGKMVKIIGWYENQTA